MTQKVGVANGAPAAKQKASFGKYISIITLALVLPIAITFILVGIISVKNNMLNSVEVSLPGTMAFVAQTLAEELESGNGELDDILKGCSLSPNSQVAVFDKSGSCVSPAGLSSSSVLAQAAKSLQGGQTGVFEYSAGGEKAMIGYAPISGTDGWKVVAMTPASDYNSGLTKTIWIYAVFAVVFIAYGYLGNRRVVKYTAEPIQVCIERLKTMSEGDFSSPIPDTIIHYSEVGELKAYLEKMRSETWDVIEDIDYTLAEIARGNFAVESRIPEKYAGDYRGLLDAQENIKLQLNSTLERIVQVSEQVSASSEQVANGAQALAQGATEQASSVEELSATIGEVARQIEASAADAEKANVITMETERIVNESSEAMEQASAAMNEISETSKDISKVIKAIDDIAFQTNILALNAAVEAARAGSAGKGFAVVADEVRNLSQKSAEAAKNTTMLIESSMQAVEKGSRLVSKANEDFEAVAAKSSQVASIVGEISEHFQQQSAAAKQIALGIEQVASVVQINSATSEESAAASEELSGQANVLRGLVAQFNLKEN